MHAHFQYLIPFSYHVHAKYEYENNISHRLIFMHTDKINKIYTIEKKEDFSPIKYTIFKLKSKILLINW